MPQNTMNESSILYIIHVNQPCAILNYKTIKKNILYMLFISGFQVDYE